MSLSSTKSTLASGEMIGQLRQDPPEQQSAGSPTKRWVPNHQKAKRLSLNLPIQPMDYYPPTISSPTTLASPTMVSPAGQRMPSPTQSSSFMVALAAQERRVLELKEELQRAESDLAELKRQWAVREAQRKRDDVRQVRRLQPLNMPLKEVEGVIDEFNDRSYLQKEQERRKAMSVDPRPSHRKVIAGQRHTRALSLLSPDKLHQPQFVAGRESTIAARDNRSQKPGAGRPILPTSFSDPANSSVEARERAVKPQEPPKEVLLRTGRQMAEDLKEGLWSLIDDLRQATIGEERVNGRYARKRQVHTAVTSMDRSGRLSEAQNGQRFNSQVEKYTKGSRRKSLAETRANDERSVLIEVGEVFRREDWVRESYELNGQNIPRKEESLISCIELDWMEERELGGVGLAQTGWRFCTTE